MPTDIKENEFYVCLLSNNSNNIYPENTLSAYTNLLKYPLKLTKDWTVGITEISFNCYNVSKSMQNRAKRDTANIGFEPLSKKFKRYVPYNTFCTVKFGDQTFHYPNNLFTYQAEIKDNVIDFSKLLSYIKQSISRPEMALYVKEVYESIIYRLTRAKESNDVAPVKYVQDQADFLVEFKLNGVKTKKAVLKHGKEHASFEKFIEDLIGQVDMSKSNYDKLIDIVNKITWPRNVGKKEKESVKFYIDLQDIGATIKIKRPLPSKLTMNEMGSLLIANMKFDNDSLDDDEKEEKYNTVIEQIRDIFTTLQAESANVPQGKPIYDPTAILNIPYEKTGVANYKTTPVPFKNQFSDLQTFLAHLFVQTPVDKRNADVIAEASKESLKKAIEEKQMNMKQKTRNKTCTGVNDVDVHDFNMMYVYTDIIQPRIIGNMHTRYLKVLPLLTKNNTVLRFDHIEYCPVEKTFIENISIKLTDKQGELIDFESSYIPTYVMLHFKQKSKITYK